MVKVRVDFYGLSCGRRPSGQRPSSDSDSSLRLHIKLAMATTQSQSKDGLRPDCNHPALGQLQSLSKDALRAKTAFGRATSTP